MSKINPETVKKIRVRLQHYLSPDVASFAGLRLEDLQQFVDGTFHPTPEQLYRLALRLGIPERNR
jgi:hypothetical protein